MLPKRNLFLCLAVLLAVCAPAAAQVSPCTDPGTEQVKISADDCDLHVQIGSSPTQNHPQVVVEIPPKLTALRNRLAAILGAIRITKTAKTFDGARAIPITVTGYLFLDTSHWCSRDLRAGCNHGRGTATLWSPGG